jgi:hypothetical protein
VIKSVRSSLGIQMSELLTRLEEAERRIADLPAATTGA